MTTRELITRRAVVRQALQPSTFDAAGLTVDAVISTFADVTRRDARGSFIERLDPLGADTSRLVGAPVLDGHRQGSARDVIGTVTAFRDDGGKLVATIQFLDSDDVRPIVERVRQGILRGVSLGYSVPRWTESTEAGRRVRTAAAWTIFEVSAVPVGADPNATFRNRSDSMEDVLILDNPPAAETPPDSTVQHRAAVRDIARRAGLDAVWADTQIDGEATVLEVRAAAFEEMQNRSRQAPRIRTITAGPSPDDMRRAREEALHVRISGGTPSDAARPFVADTLRDHARAMLEAAGVSTRGMDADQLFRAAMHTTSDFPQLLQGAGNRTLIPAYQAAQSPLRALARQTTMNDFRTGTRLKLSDIGQLEKVSESGEIKHTSRGEAAESYALDTYASMFAISRKALINDDLGAFRDWGAMAGRMAAETEANLLVKLVQSNPIMGETGKRLFSADHANLAAAGSAVSVAGLTAARLALRSMKSLDKRTPIGATPKFLVVGPALETEAEQALAAIYAATSADANTFAGRLTLLVEPRITDESWFVFADPAVLPVLEYAYLSSAQGPQMASREGWDVLGMEFRVVLDFGCGAVDWRGAYRNPGL